jgi:murein DD-endopeptidase MepM/ murein hydrolase activator NlpD
LQGAIVQGKKEKQDNAYNMFQFAFTQSNDPAMRKKALDMMADAGYDVTGINPNALTPSMEMKMMDLAAKAEADAAKFNTGQLYGQMKIGDRDVGDLVSNALTGISVRQKMDGAETMKDALETGDMEVVKDKLMVLALAKIKGMSTASYREYEAAQEATEDLNLIMMDLEGFEENYGGAYKDALERGKRLGKLNSPEWVNLKQNIGNAQAEIRKKFAGVAVTEVEQKFLNQFLIDFDKDTVRDMRIKLEGLQENFLIIRQSKINTAIDPIRKNAFQLITGEGVGMSKDVTEYDDAWFEQGFQSSSPTSFHYDGLKSLSYGVSQGFSTPIASKEKGGLYAQSTVDAWGGTHAGVDLKIPQGSKLPATTGGRVISSSFDPNWGGTIVWRDMYGAEHRYSHLSAINLKEGDTIKPGQIIGLSGGKPGTKGAGNSTGSHLDYRIRYGGQYVDPTQYSSLLSSIS